ncbi:unnamed protein product [Fraxinus pennsylvanica]|uniref:Uncharacterized protein n=1 Tax=Fraxinus pennsylvanica TaxID=56036 RepID=A0AAD2DQR0_9LAMI|nr:unnamed protein product [Fraxinus pennsylvanica]
MILSTAFSDISVETKSGSTCLPTNSTQQSHISNTIPVPDSGIYISNYIDHGQRSTGRATVLTGDGGKDKRWRWKGVGNLEVDRRWKCLLQRLGDVGLEGEVKMNKAGERERGSYIGLDSKIDGDKVGGVGIISMEAADLSGNEDDIVGLVGGE